METLQSSISFSDRVPQDVWKHIFEYLRGHKGKGSRDLLNIVQVNQGWNILGLEVLHHEIAFSSIRKIGKFNTRIRKSPGIIVQVHSLHIDLPSSASSAAVADDEILTLLLLTAHVHTLQCTGPPTMKIHILCLAQPTHAAVVSLHITRTIPCGIWGWHLFEDLKSLRTLHIECPPHLGKAGYFDPSSELVHPSVDDFGWSWTNDSAESMEMIIWLGKMRINQNARFKLNLPLMNETQAIHLQPLFRQHNVRSLEVHVPHKVLLELLPHISSIPTLILFNTVPMELRSIFQSRSISLGLTVRMSAQPEPLEDVEPEELALAHWEPFWTELQQLLSYQPNRTVGSEHCLFFQREEDSDGSASDFDWHWANQEGERGAWVARLLYYAIRLQKKRIHIFDMHGQQYDSI